MAETNQKLVMQGGMMLPENLVRSNTPMIPSRENKQKNEVITKDPTFSGVVPLSRRMATAFDKLQEKVDVDKGLQKRDTVALGKLLLEIELVNNNLKNIANEVLKSNKKVTELAEKEEEILEEEGKKLTGLAASFQNLRRQFGAFAGLVSAKEFLEGDTASGLENAGIAITAFLPEIIKVVSTVVMARMLLGGRGGGAGVATMGKGNLLSQLLVGGGLLTTGAILGSQGDSDQRRFELQKRQFLPNLLTKNDVGRFRATTTRFDNILDGTNRPVIKNNFPNQISDDVEMPAGPMEIAGNAFENVKERFFKDDEEENNEVIEETSEKGDKNLISALPTDNKTLFEESDMLLGSTLDFDIGNMSGLTNIFTGGEDDEVGDMNNDIAFNPGTSPGSSFIHVNPEYENIIKIPFALQYGGFSSMAG
tara:strand:- start:874 stop:2139 length:1266 start_codon:yes stop_codon:yes gene_type:complete